MQENHLNDNKNYWNSAVAPHFASDFYFVEAWKKGKTSLNAIEINALAADIKGKKLLHLQCHFGQDTLSWARLGASCTGIDFSETAIETAQKLNEEEGANAEFVCCDIYSLTEKMAHKKDEFDVVFTSYGTIGWLPDLDKWAETIVFFLKTGGTFYIADFHPTMWMLDDKFEHIHYSYFNDGIISEEIAGTYGDRDAPIVSTMHGWNHSFAEILRSLFRAGLQIVDFNEYPYSPYACFENMVWNDTLGGYVFPWFDGKMPMVYELKAILQD
jgi:2-polyprenyl-3-methyl-5-hydroxy-6-metoxy-1,4-benzoquinol methylase